VLILIRFLAGSIPLCNTISSSSCFNATNAPTPISSSKTSAVEPFLDFLLNQSTNPVLLAVPG